MATKKEITKKKEKEDFVTSEFTTSDFSTMAVSGASAASTLLATPGQTRIALNWTNPTVTSDLSATYIELRYDSAGAPATQAAGVKLYQGTGTGTTHTGLTAGATFYYSIFTTDKTGDWSVLTANTSAYATVLPNSVLSPNFPMETDAQIRGRFIDDGII